MKKNKLIRDLENIDEIAEKLGDRSDIWQDRFIYWMAIAIRDILLWIIKKEDSDNGQRHS